MAVACRGIRPRAAALVRVLGPALVSAMRKICAPGHAYRLPPALTKAERRALDDYFARTEALLIETILHDGLNATAGWTRSGRAKRSAGGTGLPFRRSHDPAPRPSDVPA